MSVTYVASWRCDGCPAYVNENTNSSQPPEGWAWVLPSKHFCPKCSKEKGL